MMENPADTLHHFSVSIKSGESMEQNYCIKCGEAAVEAAAFCHKCGAKLHVKQKQPPALEIQLPEPSIDPRRINLIQECMERVWILDDGFEKVHEFIRRLCAMVYQASLQNTTVQEGGCNVDTQGQYVFLGFETDHYPPDGHKALFIRYPWDIPTKFVTVDKEVPQENYLREIEIYFGEIVPNPHRDKSWVNTTYPRKRASDIEKLFTITVKHEVKEGVPTLNFFYTFNSDTVSKPVLTMLGLKWFRTKGLTASDLHAIPGMPEAMAEVKAEEMEEVDVIDEVWDEYDGRWKPIIRPRWPKSKFEKGPSWHHIYLMPTSTIHIAPPRARDLSNIERYDHKKWKPLVPRE